MPISAKISSFPTWRSIISENVESRSGFARNSGDCHDSKFFPSARGVSKRNERRNEAGPNLSLASNLTEDATKKTGDFGEKRYARTVESPTVLVTFPPLSHVGLAKKGAFVGQKVTTTRLTTFRRIVEAREGHTRRATHATTRQRRPLGNPPRAPLRTPLGARAFPPVRGRGSRTESRRFGVGSAKPPAHFTFSTCSRASPAGRGWTAAAGSANASAPGWKGNRVISRTHRQVRRNARVTAAGSTARFRDAFFSRRPLFLAFFPVRLTRDFLSSPTPAEEEEQVYAQLATLRDHLPTRYAPHRPGNARVDQQPRPSAEAARQGW